MHISTGSNSMFFSFFCFLMIIIHRWTTSYKETLHLNSGIKRAQTMVETVLWAPIGVCVFFFYIFSFFPGQFFVFILGFNDDIHRDATGTEGKKEKEDKDRGATRRCVSSPKYILFFFFDYTNLYLQKINCAQPL